MVALTHLLPIAAVLIATPAHADKVWRWRAYIDEASARFGVPASWIERVIHAESDGLTAWRGKPIRSRAGAMGLMQLMPTTWTVMRARLALGSNPDDPHDNILAGTLYLRLMYDRFGYPGLFGAYNAGPGAYAAYLAGTRRLPGETLAYLGSVGGTSSPTSPANPSPPPPSLFIVRRAGSVDQSATGEDEAQTSLFVVRKVMP